MESENIKRLKDLSDRAFERNTFCFSDFLNPTEIAEMNGVKFSTKYSLFGGADFAERKVVKFGSEDVLGYDMPFPVSVIKISPLAPKFCKTVTHRDFLGCILNKGVDRAKIGDIFTDGKTGYVVVKDTLTDFLIENIDKVGGNSVSCEICYDIPTEFKPKTESKELIVSSLRLDAVICKLYNLSREQGLQLFMAELVAINGKPSTNNSYAPKSNDVISVRGYGKFIFLKAGGNTSKGKLFVEVERYV